MKDFTCFQFIKWIFKLVIVSGPRVNCHATFFKIYFRFRYYIHNPNRIKCGRRLPILEGSIGPSRIINGKEVRPAYKFPWIVKISSPRLCSGSLISEKFVLTSAFCITKQALPNINISNKTESSSRALGRYKTHSVEFRHPAMPDYQRFISKLHDIALVGIE
ncbi:hypothetical protein NPIL_556011 [Nephila pilipes]|uniref:Peptidase S1 domain-containing protein n=1 Tax=Nephila pilipes TaxID=299642 RepID=A0A8X6TXC0_NEPPI|nr:hypothetical protein NPIL_556011 [Nephila pilipes]